MKRQHIIYFILIYIFFTSCRSTKLGLRSFVNEIYDPYETKITRKFDDYTPGSYHVVKKELMYGIIDYAHDKNIDLRAIILLGPVGILWRYNLLIFYNEDSKIKFNHLVFPHARITGKLSGIIEYSEYDALISKIISDKNVMKGIPTSKGEDENSIEFEFHYRFLLGVIQNNQERSYYINPKIEQTNYYKVVNSICNNIDEVLKKGKETYKH